MHDSALGTTTGYNTSHELNVVHQSALGTAASDSTSPRRGRRRLCQPRCGHHPLRQRNRRRRRRRRQQQQQRAGASAHLHRPAQVSEADTQNNVHQGVTSRRRARAPATERHARARLTVRWPTLRLGATLAGRLRAMGEPSSPSLPNSDPESDSGDVAASLSESAGVPDDDPSFTYRTCGITPREHTGQRACRCGESAWRTILGSRVSGGSSSPVAVAEL